MDDALTLRLGTADDVDWLLARFDEAITWMVARGQSGQWGTEPMSSRATARERMTEFCTGGGLRIASVGGDALGALVVGQRPPHVAAIERPELYIDLLIVARDHGHRGLGAWLVQSAVAEARTRGVQVVRVDCWAGAPPLVAWYEAQGFTRAGTFTVKVNDRDWVGQVFSLEL